MATSDPRRQSRRLLGQLLCCHSFPTLRKCMVMYSTKGTCVLIPCFTFIIKNMIIIEMNIRMSRVVIPFLFVSGVSMAMRACLGSFPAMGTAKGWWGCITIILFPRQFRRCLRRIWHLRAFSLSVSQACNSMFIHNLQSLSYSLVINTKLFFLLVPRPGKEPHVCPCNWGSPHLKQKSYYVTTKPQRKSTSFTSFFVLERTDDGFSSSVVGGSHSPTSFLTYPSPVWWGNSSTLMGLTMPWPLTLKPFPSHPILFNSLEPILVVWF